MRNARNPPRANKGGTTLTKAPSSLFSFLPAPRW
jgi:hypothetical protein